jgi:hypothetical protein
VDSCCLGGAVWRFAVSTCSWVFACRIMDSYN